MALSSEKGTLINGSANLLIPRDKSRSLSSGQSPKGRKSNLESDGNDDEGGSGMHSLAHELAVALMPEPSANSKMLSEEFGIEFDEGAEGIDEPEDGPNAGVDSLADELGGLNGGNMKEDRNEDELHHSAGDEIFSHFSSPGPLKLSKPQPLNEDPMERLSRDLESTDKLLSQLRYMDADAGHHSSLQPSIEKFASDMIRHINDTVRDREGQVRELLECEREFRKIAGEINGNDVLGRLDALERVEGLGEDGRPMDTTKPNRDAASDVPDGSRNHQRVSSSDWETNPDALQGDDPFDEEADPTTPMKDSFFVAPPVTGPPTVSKIIPHFVHMRSLTTSLASSLTVMSEHAQVNGAATADAGRKIRALKNKLGGWRSEWDSAERSRSRIERWEAGVQDDDSSAPGTPPKSSGARRTDSRRVVEEHLKAFELALADAGMKTQAIMAKT